MADWLFGTWCIRVIGCSWLEERGMEVVDEGLLGGWRGCGLCFLGG